ncbi:MAG: ribosome biogenesis GTPase Der [Planctomycetes bacterium]|nr:ribosome biogenesis GTPase Der [Planctomycetota bacterium]
MGVSLPKVAIVGRPNVGKSSLLNCLARQRISIVDEMPGVTRDRVTAIVSHGDTTMELIDTGGIGMVDRDDLEEHVERQISKAIHDANAILFVTDVREGVTALDREVARRLRDRAREIPVFLVVNKVDSASWETHVLEFHELGMGEPIPVSAAQIYGTRDLLDRVVEKLPPTGDVDVEPVMKLAVVGRQNVGKSTFVNALAREERVIVSEVPGTTRDTVDVRFEKDGRRFVVIDTAGVKQKTRAKTCVELYSQVRTEAAIRRADVVLLLLDATQEVTRGDKRLGDFIAQEGRVCIVVVNKWDLTGGDVTTEAYGEYLYDRLRGLRYAPIVFVTAKDSRNVQSAVDLAQHLFKTSLRRVGTGELNRVLRAVQEQQRPRPRGGKLPKMYYATQVGTAPPTFVVFVNYPACFPEDYRRYVESAFREALGLQEIPLRVIYRAREREDAER